MFWKNFIIALVVLFGIAAVLLLVTYTRPAQAQNYEYWDEDRGGYWMDPNENAYQQRSYPGHQRYQRIQPVPTYGGGYREQHWSDIANPPQFSTYPGR